MSFYLYHLFAVLLIDIQDLSVLCTCSLFYCKRIYCSGKQVQFVEPQKMFCFDWVLVAKVRMYEINIYETVSQSLKTTTALC